MTNNYILKNKDYINFDMEDLNHHFEICNVNTNAKYYIIITFNKVKEIVITRTWTCALAMGGVIKVGLLLLA